MSDSYPPTLAAAQARIAALRPFSRTRQLSRRRNEAPLLVLVYQLSAACERMSLSQRELLEIFLLASTVNVIATLGPTEWEP